MDKLSAEQRHKNMAAIRGKNTNHVIRISTVNLNQDWQMIEQRLNVIIQEQKQ